MADLEELPMFALNRQKASDGNRKDRNIEHSGANFARENHCREVKLFLQSLEDGKAEEASG